MAGKFAIVLLCVSFSFAGCLDELAGAAESLAEGVEDALEGAEVNVLVLEGHMIEGTVGELSHTRETETLLWEIQQVGWKVMLEEPVVALEFAVAWKDPDGFQYKFESHSHDHETELCCIIHQSPHDGEKNKCVRIPAEDAMHGEWEPMVRSTDWVGGDFTLYVITLGPPAVLVDERHGHNRANELPPPIGEGREDQDRPVEPCVLWDADAERFR